MAIGNVFSSLPLVLSLEGMVALGILQRQTADAILGGQAFTMNFEAEGIEFAIVFRGNGLSLVAGLPVSFTGTVNSIEVYANINGAPQLVSFLILPFATPLQEMVESVIALTVNQRVAPDVGGADDVTFESHPEFFDLILPPDGGFGMVYTGSDGADVVNGYVTDDSLNGAGGDDAIRLSPGVDTIDGGEGTDIADGRLADSGITYDGATGQGSYGANSFSMAGIEVMIGSDHADTLATGGGTFTLYGEGGADVLTGQGQPELLSGGAGDDTLTGGGGFDTLEGDGGADVITGGDGYDAIDGGEGDDSMTGNNGFDTLVGGAGDDTGSGGLGLDTLQGGDGNDSLSGNAGFDLIEGGADNDTLIGNSGADTLRGDDGRDSLNGGTNNDLLEGGADADTLSGSNGADTLLGGEGADILNGNAGADRLEGGADDDILRGGLGQDTFVFAVGMGTDVVIDFQNNFDTIEIDADLLGGGTPVPDDLRAYASINGDGNLVLDFGNGDMVTFNNTGTTAAILDDVVFV